MPAYCSSLRHSRHVIGYFMMLNKAKFRYSTCLFLNLGTISVCFKKSPFSILNINEKLPLTRVHLTQEHICIFLDRELPFVQLSFLWCSSHMNAQYPFTSEHQRFLWEFAKWWWFLKVWASLAVFDGIIETISMAFSMNIFQAHTGMFVFENNVFTFW